MPPRPSHDLVTDLAKIPAHGLMLDTDIPASELELAQEEEQLVAGPVRVQGRLTKIASEQVYFDGRLEGAFEGECSRCLDPVCEDFKVEAQAVFVPESFHGGGEDGDILTDDPDLYTHDGVRLDLYPLVRDQVVLALPVQLLCREECVGLCQVCGGNRNEQPCACQVESVDPRFAILQRLNLPQSS